MQLSKIKFFGGISGAKTADQDKKFGVKGGDRLGALEKDTLEISKQTIDAIIPDDCGADDRAEAIDEDWLSPAELKALEKAEGINKKYFAAVDQTCGKSAEESANAILEYEKSGKKPIKRTELGTAVVPDAEGYLKAKDYEKTIEYFTAAIENGVARPNSYHKRAYAEVQLGRFEEGIADYTKALQIKEKLENTYKCRGDARMQYRGTLSPKERKGSKGQGLLMDAINDYERAVELKPRAVTYDNLGVAYSQLGTPEGYLSATECYKESTKINEVELENAKKALDEAVKEFDKIIDETGSDKTPEAVEAQAKIDAADDKVQRFKKGLAKEYYRMGVAFKHAEGDDEHAYDKQAHAALMKSLEHVPGLTADTAYYLGLVVEGHEARTGYLKAAIEMNPNVPAYHDALARERSTMLGKFFGEDEADRQYSEALDIMHAESVYADAKEIVNAPKHWREAQAVLESIKNGKHVSNSRKKWAEDIVAKFGGCKGQPTEQAMERARAIIQRFPNGKASEEDIAWAQGILQKNREGTLCSERHNVIWANHIMQMHYCSPTEVTPEDLEKAKTILKNYKDKQDSIQIGVATERARADMIRLRQTRQEQLEQEFTEKKTVMLK